MPEANEAAYDDLQACLQAQIDEFARVVLYKPFGGSAVELQAIYRSGFIDGIQDSSHALLTIMPGARVDASDTLHLPNTAAENTGDVVTVDSVERRVIEIKRERGRFTRVTIALA